MDRTLPPSCWITAILFSLNWKPKFCKTKSLRLATLILNEFQFNEERVKKQWKIWTMRKIKWIWTDMLFRRCHRSKEVQARYQWSRHQIRSALLAKDLPLLWAVHYGLGALTTDTVLELLWLRHRRDNIWLQIHCTLPNLHILHTLHSLHYGSISYFSEIFHRSFHEDGGGRRSLAVRDYYKTRLEDGQS